MSGDEATFAATMRDVLGEHARRGIPDSLDLWARLERAAMEQQHLSSPIARRGGAPRVVLVAAVCLVLCLGGVTAAAASPAVRGLIHHALPFIPSGQPSETMSAHGFPLHISPAPRFRVFYPAKMPAGLIVSGIAHGRGTDDNMDSGSGYGFTCPTSTCAGLLHVNAPALFVPPDHSSGSPILFAPFIGRPIEVVWFGKHAVPPDRRFIQIAEWDASKAPPRSSTYLAPRKSLVAHDTIITVTKDGTAIEVATNMGSRTTQSIVDSLRPTALGAR